MNKKRILSGLLSSVLVSATAVMPVSAEGGFVNNLLLVGGNGNVTVSWQSGDCENLGRIELYDSSNSRMASSAANAKANVTVLGTDNNRIPRESNTGYYVNITDLNLNTEYSYWLKTTSKTGDMQEHKVSPVKTKKQLVISDGWENEYPGLAFSKAEITDDDAIVGIKSLKIQSNANEDNCQKLIPKLNTELSDGTKYGIEFYAKGNGINGIFVGDDEKQEFSDFTGSWEKYSSEFVFDGTNPEFVIADMCEGLYIDWVVIKELDNEGKLVGSNLVSDGNFEVTEAAAESGVPTALNFMSAGRDKGAVVSWRNPKTNDIKTVELFDGNENLITDSITGDLSTASGASNNIYVGDLSNGTSYKFRLKITYKDGTSYATEAESNVLNDAGMMLWGAPKGVQPVSGWSEAVAGGTYVKFQVTGKEAYSGNASLLVRCNLDSEKSNTFQRFGPDMKTPLVNGKTYRVSYYLKSENADSYYLKSENDEGVELRENPGTTSEWTKKTLSDFVYTGGGIFFCFERRADALYIDNFEIYEVDENGETTGENLAKNGDFEEGFVSVAPGEVSGAVAEKTMEKANISWKSAPADAAYVHVYVKNGDSEYLRAIVKPTDKSVALNGGVSNEFILRTVNQSGVESEGVSVDCEPAAVEISEPLFEQNGSYVDTLNTGELTVSRIIKNNGMGDDFTALMIVALYEGNLLKGYKTIYKILPELGDNASAVELSLSINVDEVTENTNVKVYLWDSMELRNSISDVTVIN